ncbi:DUF2306 domain-containing protein [Parasphingorhabdus sp.]|uniref:DUF2306 domain-containing protein n=1 Tax=Parasphingorhabdus sp. TaxID=2709688 RepID=UPI003C71FF31
MPADRRTAKGYSVPGLLMMTGATILLTLLLMAFSSFGSGDVAATANITDRLTLPVILHLATVVPALPLGAYILLRRKGDRLHKFLGRTWASLMMITAITSFWMGRPDGSGLFGTHLSFIHIFAVITLVSIPLGVWQARIGNIKEHYRAMQGPYIGLIIAGIFAFIPGRIMGSLVFG